MIRRARSTDVSQLSNLWRECFFANDEELSFFFGRLFRAYNTWVYEDNECICAMLYVLPYQIDKNGVRYPVHYFYAIGTTEKMRKQGFAGELIRHATEQAKLEGCPFCFLVPQSQGLFSYYERFGFYPCVMRSLPYCEPIGFRRAEYSDIPHLNQIYENALRNRPHLIRTCEDWKVLIDEMKEIRISNDSYLVYHEKGYAVEGFGGAMRMGERNPYAAFCIIDKDFELKDGYFNLLHD